jgi:pyruvate dehydrogenase E1 component alpha subunit
VAFFCENNLYAMGTALAREHAQTDLALRAASYGMVSWAVDGMDVLAVRDAALRAVELVRDSGEPCFVELRTYRFRAHSMYDPDRYRDKAEIERWRERDPIPALTKRLGLDHTVLDGMETKIAAEIERAIGEAEAAPEEPVEQLTRFVYSEAGK